MSVSLYEPPDTRNWTLATGPFASASRRTDPETVAPFDGITILVERFWTVMVIGGLYATPDALSVARARSEYVPSGTVVVSQESNQPYALFVAVPTTASDNVPPVMRKSTPATGPWASASRSAAVPESVEPSEGTTTRALSGAFTTWLTDADVDAGNVASPLYAAVIACVPSDNADVTRAAVPDAPR